MFLTKKPTTKQDRLPQTLHVQVSLGEPVEDEVDITADSETKESCDSQSALEGKQGKFEEASAERTERLTK